MNFVIFTLFPEIFQGYLEASILGKAASRGLISLELVNIRDHSLDKHKTCDSSPYGGGAGMVLKPEPLSAALKATGAAKTKKTGAGRVVYLTPSGTLYNQSLAEILAGEETIYLICGRYEGIDQRIIDLYVTDEISVGDYILSGGEVAAMAVIDSVARLVRGVIKERSLEEESFRRGLLEYPQYARPDCFEDLSVPEVLLSGNHAEIERWRLKKSVEKTIRYRPELIDVEKAAPEVVKTLEHMRTEGEEDGQD